jgi:phospholipase/carboxylesterase
LSAGGGSHQGQPVLAAGEPLAKAAAAMVLVHGRGASARDILSLAGELAQPGFAYLAPQAAGGTWYPNSFLAPLASNEPALSSALTAVGAALERAAEAGLAVERTFLLGFSQGACLALEYAARNARRYGGLVGLSGGLIGPEGTPRAYPGSLAETPVFLGCDLRDPHIPAERVRETAAVMRELGGDVTMRLYGGLGHGINQDELAAVRSMMAGALASP